MARKDSEKQTQSQAVPHHATARERIEKSHEIRKATSVTVRRAPRFSHSAMGNR